jgi:alcohol dehydrogenase (cytochrome c)
VKKCLWVLVSVLIVAVVLCAQGRTFRQITDQMLKNPDPSDWLMLNRTYDEQRFSPLSQINRSNVAQLNLAWSRGLPRGRNETVPIVADGVMYVARPGGGVLALNATNGDLIWEYLRDMPKEATEFIGGNELARPKSLAIYQDLIFHNAPDGFLVALDARTGKVRWETKVHDYKDLTEHSSGPIVAAGKVITGRQCENQRKGCFIAAHDAMTGQEVWRFYNTAAPGDPGGDSWGNVSVDKRIASTWGLPGSYDPIRNLVYWGISNPKPYTRLLRHGSVDDISRTAPADLFSNSTVAINVGNGTLNWYYQHLPGDDWDLDHTHERTLLHTRFNPDPKAVKWINPKVPQGSEHDVVVAVGEGGGIWVIERGTGQFLWAMPFPVDVPEFAISEIDVETGRTHINSSALLMKDGDRHVVCFHNTRGYWSTAYDPGRNSLYIPYHDGCLDMAANNKDPMGGAPRRGILRPGADPQKYANIAKVNLSTGKKEIIYSQPEAGNGSALVTAGDLLFWGDMNRRFRAFDSDTGKILWETLLGGVIQTSTISYGANGKQYIAVLTGAGWLTPEIIPFTTKRTVRDLNEIYVFALLDKR